MAYYKRIRDLREDNDKTQKEVAEYLGTPYQYYAVYEKGKSEISFERAIALAKYYNVSLDYIAGLTDKKRELSETRPKKLQNDLDNIIASMTSAEKKKAAALLSIMTEILKS